MGKKTFAIYTTRSQNVQLKNKKDHSMPNYYNENINIGDPSKRYYIRRNGAWIEGIQIKTGGNDLEFPTFFLVDGTHFGGISWDNENLMVLDKNGHVGDGFEQIDNMTGAQSFPEIEDFDNMPRT